MFDSCIMIAVRTGKPSFSRKDKMRTHLLLADAGASSADAARVSKSLFPENQALKDINAADQRLLQYVKKHTAAWSSPFRIIQAAKYPEFRLELDQMMANRDPLVSAFITDYAIAQKEAKDALGDLYNPMDYVPAEIVASKFYQYVEVNQIPSNDWRVEAATAHEAAVRKAVESSRDAQYRSMLKGHYQRLQELLLVESKDGCKLFDDYLRSGPQRFHQSRIDEIRQHCKFMKDMNLGNDAELDELATRLDTALGAYNLETLRHDPSARNDVADKITSAIKDVDLAAKLNDFLG